MNEIQLADKTPGQAPEKKEESKTEDFEPEADDFETMQFLQLLPKTFVKSTLWFSVAVAFCAMRSATTFIVVMAYMQVVARAVQLIGMILKNRKIAQVAYSISTFIILIMFMAAMADESHKATYEDI